MTGRFRMRVRGSRRGRTPEEVLIDRFLLLYLLNQVPEGIGDTALQKLGYLSQFEMHKQGHKGFNYTFIKLPYGPYSEDLSRDVEDLQAKRIITGFKHKPTMKGCNILNNFNHLIDQNITLTDKIKRVNISYSRYDRDTLVDIVHKMCNPNNPRYTIHETRQGSYILKRPLMWDEKLEFKVTESDIASLELYFEPSDYSSVVESMQEAQEKPAIKYQ